ncbi:hypothetical protein Tco_0277884 [Tanacetum coccineum]
MVSTRASISKASKRPKINIIPPKQLFVDLTYDDTKTPSPTLQLSSPSAPNAPSKTPSTKDTSSFSIDYIPKSPTLSTSLSPNGYLNPPTSSPLRVSPPPPTQENASMDITLTLSPITPLDVQFNTPSPSPPIVGHSIPWNLLEAHGDSYLCCIHNPSFRYTVRSLSAFGLSSQFTGVDAETTFHFWGPLNTSLSKVGHSKKSSIVLIHGFGPHGVWQWRQPRKKILEVHIPHFAVNIDRIGTMMLDLYLHRIRAIIFVILLREYDFVVVLRSLYFVESYAFELKISCRAIIFVKYCWNIDFAVLAEGMNCYT